MTRSRKLLPPRRLWSESEVQILRRMYPSRPSAEIAIALRTTVARVYAKANAIGLKKTEERRRASGFQKGSTVGAVFRFKKGQVPINKGVRRRGWHAGRMKETQFKKGERSGIAARNWRPIGTILADNEGYLRIKVREAVHGKEATGFGNVKVWPLYGRYLWEQHKGPIPPKHVVIFKDGDRSNCVIENVELLPRADLARRNGMWKRLPRELAEVIQLNGALKRKMRRLYGEEHDKGSA
jgi:hypothetical protein